MGLTLITRSRVLDAPAGAGTAWPIAQTVHLDADGDR
jgi:hypothetical protein